MRTYWITIMMACLMSIALPATSSAEILGNYLGVEACVACHGDVVEGWRTTPHGTAFDTLKEQGGEKQSIPGCFKCHVVGFEQDGGYVDMELTPELRDVQCEACHGPGRAHVESEGDPSVILGKPGEQTCRVCHTEGQDKNFDYEVKKQWVHKAPEASQASRETAASDADVLAFSERNVEFGNMTEGDVVERKVRVTNTGQAPIRITNLTTSCSCTSAVMESSALQPNESTLLTITYNTFKFPGKFEKFVTLFTDGGERTEYVVRIHGYVDPIPMGVLEVAPRKITLEGSRKVGESVPVRVDIANTGDKEMEVTRIVLRKQQAVLFDAGAKGAVVIRPGETVSVDVTVTSDKAGRMLDYIMIHSNARNVTDKGYKVVLVANFE